MDLITNNSGIEVNNSTAHNMVFGNQINININIDQRGNLKDRFDGQEYEFDMFGIHVSNLKKEPGFDKVLCINIYSNYEFITDHAFVKFPDDFYADDYNYSLIKIIGKVYKYKRADNTEDYSIEVTKVLDICNRMIGIFKNDFGIIKEVQEISQYDILMNSVDENFLYDIVQEQLQLFDMVVSLKSHVRKGFMTGYLLTRYFLNTQLQALVSQRIILREASKEVLLDILEILSYLIYQIDKGGIWMWRHLLNEINSICNYKQGVFKEYNDRNKSEDKEIFDNLKLFSNKINCDNVKKNHWMNKVYNRNVGFVYPNKDNYEDILKQNTLSYLLSKGYLKC